MADLVQPTPANLSAPELAKVRAKTSCSALRTLTHTFPALEARGQLVDVIPGAIATSGGFSDRLKNDWQVNPAGDPSCMPVTTTIPVAKWPRTARKSLTSIVTLIYI